MKMGNNEKQNPDRKATFFKVLIGEFIKEIKIPPAFALEYKELIPETLRLKSYNLGKSYVVSVTRNEDGLFLKKNGWKKFVKDHVLEVGDFLVFNLVDDATFQVLIYGPNCCLKRIKLADDEDQKKKNSSSKLISTASGSKESTCKKRGRPRLSQSKTPQISAAKTDGKGKRTRTVKVNNRENMIEGEEEEAGGKMDHHPSAEIVLKEYQRFNLTVPKRFAVKSGLENVRKTTIEDPLGRKWPVYVKIVGFNQVHLSTGWSNFHGANGLVTGDTLILHAKQEHVNVITVEIVRKHARTDELPASSRATTTTTTKSELIDI